MSEEDRTLPVPVPRQKLALDQIIAAWLHAKEGRTQSKETRRKYESIIFSFRETLQGFHLDLDGDTELVAVAAQGWATRSFHEDDLVGNATYNQRLAALSSFYKYARQNRMLLIENPIDFTTRKPVQPYANAHAMAHPEVQRRLNQISRATLPGLRDYALLTVALMTGRRASELAGMHWGHLREVGEKVTITFPRCKGGKVMHDTLNADASKTLLHFLRKVYGADLSVLPADAPIWMSFARNASNGGAISTQAIADIWQKWLGDSKVHLTRHTFAKGMKDSGASIEDIGKRLGHSNEATTRIYVQSLESDQNPYADKLAVLFGIEAEEPS